MKIVFLLFKVMLLSFGLVLLAGGGLLGVCGVAANHGGIFLLGLIPALIGFAITAFVIRDFNRRARAGKTSVVPPSSLPDEGEQ